MAKYQLKRKKNAKLQNKSKTVSKVRSKNEDSLQASHDFMMKKAIIRVAKAIKAKLILKTSKRMKETQTDDISRAELLASLEEYKAIDHVLYGGALHSSLRQEDDDLPGGVNMNLFKIMKSNKLFRLVVEEMEQRLLLRKRQFPVIPHRCLL
jgi:hypothetical protein